MVKLLAYNISVLIHEVFEHGIDPGVPGIKLSPPPGPVPTVDLNAIPLPPMAVPLALPAPVLERISHESRPLEAKCRRLGQNSPPASREPPLESQSRSTVGHYMPMAIL